MKAYIEQLDMIKIESKTMINDVSLNGYTLTFSSKENDSYYYKTNKDIDLHVDHYIHINQQPYRLKIGFVTITEAFDQKYRYDGPLGYQYTKSNTSFYLFSPVAKQVQVKVDGKLYDMQYDCPIWHVKIPGDLEHAIYQYRIRIEDEFKDVNDPYANAATTKGNVIIDWHKTYQMKYQGIHLDKYVDAVIYEGHVRDMTITLDVENPGTFDALIEENHVLNQSVISYVKQLGATHLQLLPIYDFELVDEWHKNASYNWGYNPSQYFVLEGWYSKNPDDPYDRINSLKKVIDEAHRIGLGINMDVVYNHVFNHHTFPYDHIVPHYFYRHDEKMEMTNGSFCGNEIETRRYMVRKLIVDSLIHFATNYLMDGFRFDLMGLIDIDTMNQIQKKLRKINPKIMLYGEGWHMDSVLPDQKRSSMNNHQDILAYAHFNDSFRNTIKGKLNTTEIGYAFGSTKDKELVGKLLQGSYHMFNHPNQTINYVECHDNLTFYDRMLLNFNKHTDDLFVYQDFVNHLIAISQGIPFYHAGQEFYRSKQGVENSYESPDEINKINWKPHLKSIDKLKEILKIRKTYDLYRLNTYNHHDVYVEIKNDMIVYILENDKYKLIHYIHNQFKDITIDHLQGEIIFNSQPYKLNNNQLTLSKPGIYISYVQKV